MNNSNNKKTILDQFSGESPEMAEFRRTYAKLRHLNNGKNLKNFMITSSCIGEGKSTVSALFASTISRYHKTKTLLIDADLRRPKVHELFNLKQENGLAEALSGKKEIKELFKNSQEENLQILTAGKVDTPPSDLFNSTKVPDVFNECKFYFDTIIIDCPPIIPVSDPLVIGPEMDGVIMVIRAGKTKKEIVKRAKDLLVDSGINIIGIILNNYGEVLPYYYDYKYYGYQYYKETNGKK